VLELLFGFWEKKISEEFSKKKQIWMSLALPSRASPKIAENILTFFAKKCKNFEFLSNLNFTDSKKSYFATFCKK